MEFDPDFKLLLSPDKVAETNTIIEGATIQANAAIKAAEIQANAAIQAANIQWDATFWGSVAVTFAALVAFFSVIWQTSTEKRIYRNKVNAYRRFVQYKCETIYLELSQAKFIISGVNISSSENPIASAEFSFSFIKSNIDDLSPNFWDTHALLGGEVMGLINDLFESMVQLRDAKDYSLKNLLSLKNLANENTEEKDRGNKNEYFLDEFEKSRGLILNLLEKSKEKNDALIKFLSLPPKISPIDTLWTFKI